MESYLEQIKILLPQARGKALFSRQDVFVILQGVTGFASSAAVGDVFGVLNAALPVGGHFATKCSLGNLKADIESIEHWLRFGVEFKALKDSSDLNFDNMDVGSVPEVMKVAKNPCCNTFIRRIYLYTIILDLIYCEYFRLTLK